MVIFELGIVKSGIVLVSKQYYAEYNISDSPILRGGFLSGINSFVEQTFSDEIESFQMKNYKILFWIHTLNEATGSKIIFYCIGDKKLNLKIAKKTLIKLSEEFIKKYGNLEQFKGDISIFNDFEEVIDKILGDLIRSADDRVRSIFEGPQ